jgi:hypothetical protein
LLKFVLCKPDLRGHAWGNANWRRGVDKFLKHSTDQAQVDVDLLFDVGVEPVSESNLAVVQCGLISMDGFEIVCM